MNFFPENPPFPYWTGPYSPARGNKSGFRVKSGKLGTWVNSDVGRSFCTIQESAGVSQLSNLVPSHWQGGRILLTPAGYVVKPLPNEGEIGLRVVIGRFEGEFWLVCNGQQIDLSSSLSLSAGSPWPGPSTIGLECVIKSDGSLVTQWNHPSEYGQEIMSETISGPNKELLAGLKKARPNDNGARVRVTIGGHVISNKRERDGWAAFYVGRVCWAQFQNWGKWVQRR